MDDRTIKKNILKRRKSLDLSQAEMADRLKMDRTTYRNIEAGTTKILGGHIEEIARALETSTEYLVFGYDPESAGDNPVVTRLMAGERNAHEAIVSSYEARIEALLAELEIKQKRIDELERWLRDKETLNSFLSARVRELENRK